MKIIEVTVTQDGHTRVQTKGFIGRSCKAASKFIERALGYVTSDRLTNTEDEHQCQNKCQS